MYLFETRKGKLKKSHEYNFTDFKFDFANEVREFLFKAFIINSC